MRGLHGFLLCAALGLAACQNDAKAEGQATYARPAEEGGRPVARQGRGDLSLTVRLQGDAVWDLVQGVACALTQGSASGEVNASGNIDGNGNYASAFATASGEFNSPSDVLCDQLEGVDFSSLVQVQVEGSIPANEENCSDFCQASAEAECEGDLQEAQCIADFTASCESDCSNASRITGQGEISADALATLNGDLSGSGKINASVNLVFDSFE